MPVPDIENCRESQRTQVVSGRKNDSTANRRSTRVGKKLTQLPS